MNNTAAILEFSTRAEYRTWLEKNNTQEQGIWIQFTKGNKNFTAQDALEESLCFGWIDGVMKSIDERFYKKYFSKRKDCFKWSEKNRALYEKLIQAGLMTQAGKDVFKAPATEKKPVIDMSEKINVLRELLQEDKEVLALYDNTSPSRQKQLAGFYGEAKTDETKNKRKIKIMDALKNNYTGMLY